jgi:hypothetical protein
MTAPRVGAGWIRSPAEGARRALVPLIVVLLGFGAALGVAACGTAKPVAQATPTSAPDLLPPPENSAAGSADATSSTDTTATDTTATDTTGASGTTTGTTTGTTSGTTGGAAVTPSTGGAGTTSGGTSGTATTPSTGGAGTTSGGTSGTATTPSTGGAGPSAFCTANPGVC